MILYFHSSFLIFGDCVFSFTICYDNNKGNRTRNCGRKAATRRAATSENTPQTAPTISTGCDITILSKYIAAF